MHPSHQLHPPFSPTPISPHSLPQTEASEVRITLAYTDSPVLPSSALVLYDNLDLAVFVNGVMVGPDAEHSVQVFDAFNNVERAILHLNTNGMLTCHVTATVTCHSMPHTCHLNNKQKTSTHPPPQPFVPCSLTPQMRCG